MDAQVEIECGIGPNGEKRGRTQRDLTAVTHQEIEPDASEAQRQKRQQDRLEQIVGPDDGREAVGGGDNDRGGRQLSKKR